ncbi:unnamed protein product [Bursaphelenchus okinawaensis]|uniref:5'-tyrosyl-DNA phosphodiesterase n=1 Tax=Bursaphelenchus okinawaensis TaxID=465554 RepID=A0A811JT97_9BILA|nr:unnamed protein product [Bursaphelenchus okinawaensis]CAG9082257.1 unnamed protein product [Bursaphelenchus okinawaensis]
MTDAVSTCKSEAECERAIKEFTELTQTDEAFAHFVLQDVNFDLEAGVFKYFTEINPDAPLPEQIIKEVLDHPPQSSGSNGIPPELTAVSWNIDGLNKSGLSQRFLAIITVLARHNPEVIFFQEFVPQLEDKLYEVLGKMYNICQRNLGRPYYNVTLVSKNIRINYETIQNFSNSGMGRHMVIVRAKWRNLKLCLINTHLESEKSHTDARQTQFKECMETVKESLDDEAMVLFGGDLNLRDAEVSNVPDGVRDCWEFAGRPENCRYTWDMSKNDNLEFPNNIRYKLKCRFDRFYVSGPYRRVDFAIDGQERIKNLRMFPSDHFAIIARFTRPN